MILKIIVSYYTIQFMYYLYHRFIHLPCSGPLYRMHYIGHHKTQFPLRRLRALHYGNVEGGGWFETGGEIVFGVPILCILALLFIYAQFADAMIVTLTLLYVLISGDVLHSSFHLYDNAESHPESLYIHKLLVKTNFFRRLQSLHDIHHAHTNTNFGFGDFTFDYLFGTFNSQR
jgi:hypothetical protein